MREKIISRVTNRIRDPKPLLRRFGLQFYADKIFLEHTNNKVIAGPFSGLEFPITRFRSRVEKIKIAKLILGTYEKELGPLITRLSKHHFDQIVNVGASIGYYAVGSALTWPDANVVAYEEREEAQTILNELASVNGVSNQLDTKGFCDVDSLCSSLKDVEKCLVFMDVEGGEKELLNPTEILYNVVF